MPYWGPSLATDGQTVLCYSPATSDTTDDTIYVVDRKTGKMVEVTTGASPAFVRNGTTIVFERWVNRWSDKASSNLWILELKPGAVAAKNHHRRLRAGRGDAAEIKEEGRLS